MSTFIYPALSFKTVVPPITETSQPDVKLELGRTLYTEAENRYFVSDFKLLYCTLSKINRLI